MTIDVRPGRAGHSLLASRGQIGSAQNAFRAALLRRRGMTAMARRRAKTISSAARPECSWLGTNLNVVVLQQPARWAKLSGEKQQQVAELKRRTYRTPGLMKRICLQWRTRRENVLKPCCALGRRYPGNCIVMRPERRGNVANPASRRHDRRAEARGQAIQAGGEIVAGGKCGWIAPDIITRSNGGACARFSHGENCRA